jgi:nickel/cobalt transporter (NiCoT) family protein
MTVHTSPGRWTRAERVRLSGVFTAIAGLHILGWTLFLYYSHRGVAAGTFAGAGTLAYVLGMRHAFDADHIAAIDDTTRLMLLRGRRPVGVGFFFAMGHSTVVLVLALVVAAAAGTVTQDSVEHFQHVGGTVSTIVAMLFLALVAGLNLVVLRSITRLWRGLRAGEFDSATLDEQLLNRGLMNRVLGGRVRSLIKSSWHMYPVGILFGLGLETASEVLLLSLTASTAAGGRLPLLATMSLPLLFAAGMSFFDTADSLLMTRAYSWAYRNPARKLYYNIATTAMTVVIAGFIAAVYLAGVLDDYAGWTFLGALATLADHFELFGYVIIGIFVATWLVAAAGWRFVKQGAETAEAEA